MAEAVWEIETSDEFILWYRSLDDDEAESVNFSVDILADGGPLLGRPHVDTLKGSRIPNLKNCAYSMKASRSVSCSSSIPGASAI